MKSPAVSLIKKGFTLVELLVVISIVAALAAISFTVVMNQVAKARLVKAKDSCVNIASAIENFYVDNNTLPVSGPFPRQGETISTDIDDPHQLIAVLVGREQGASSQKINKTGRKYLAGSTADDKIGGLYVEARGAGYYDEWGQPYYVLMDVAGRDEIADPFTGKPILGKRAIVYCSGPDGTGNGIDGSIKNRENNDDNIYSWK